MSKARGEGATGRPTPHDTGTCPECRGSQSTHHSIPARRASLRKL